MFPTFEQALKSRCQKYCDIYIWVIIFNVNDDLKFMNNEYDTNIHKMNKIVASLFKIVLIFNVVHVPLFIL